MSSRPGENAPSRPAASIEELIAEQTALNPDAVALLAPGRAPSSYAQLLAHLRRAASEIRARGFGLGDRVAIVLPNGPEMATAFLATAMAATAAPLNPAYREQEIDFYLTDLEAKAVLVQAGGESPAVSVARRLGIPVLEIAVSAASPAGCFEIQGGARSVARPSDPVSAKPEDVALVLHTSGTTARPKLVPLTHANLCRSARNIRETLQLAASDRCLNVLPLFHIHGLVAAVLASLAAGGSVVATPGFLATRFFDWMDELSPTWYTAVPTIHQSILGRAGTRADVIARRPLRFIRSSSAALPPRVMADLEAAFGAPVIEACGMTEAAHQLTCNPLPPGARKPGSVGRAAGPEVAIMDDAGNLLGQGRLGEVVLRGENVTPGYHKNPEANRKSFTNGWFRTGDQGYLDPDGYLFLTGRLKEIINRGGEKISPREIDEALGEHPAVEQVVTFAIPDSKLGEEIGAAIVLKPGARATQGQILEFAARKLADFKLPRRVLFLAELPKGPTGKLQRIGLAEKLGIRADEPAKPEDGTARVAPRTDTERALADLYRGVLEIEELGIHESFFELGGDSLIALELSAAIEETFGVEVPIFVLLEKPTIETLAAHVDAVRNSCPRPPVPPIVRRDHAGESALSPGQELLWVQEQLVRATPINHRPGALRIAGALDPKVLGAALAEIVRRHEALRTVFVPRKGRPVAVVQPAAGIDLPVEDLSALAPDARSSRLNDIAVAQVGELFDLERGPLLRARLVRLGEREHVLFLNVHHIAFDGWSMSILASELAALYGAFLAGRPSPLTELPIQYADFAEWQRARMESPEIREGLEYWRGRLAGDPPDLALPESLPHPPRPSGRGREHERLLPADLENRLHALGRREGVTLFMTLLTGFLSLIHALTRREDIVIGTITSGRSTKELGLLIGLFMNQLVVRADLSGNPTFREALSRVRKVILGALANQEVPFALLARTLHPKGRFLRNPFFDVAFQLRNIPEARGEGGGLGIEETSFDWGLARYDLLVEASRKREGLVVRFEYSTDVLEEGTIRRWAEGYLKLLEAAAADPSARLSRLAAFLG